MLKLFGMFFLFLILFFVLFALCIAHRVKVTLRTLLKNRAPQENDSYTKGTYFRREQEGMVIDVEAQKR